MFLPLSEQLPQPSQAPQATVKMTRGESTQTKVHYKGNQDDFIVFVDDVEAYKKFKEGDTSIPMAQFISSFAVFHTNK